MSADQGLHNKSYQGHSEFKHGPHIIFLSALLAMASTSCSESEKTGPVPPAELVHPLPPTPTLSRGKKNYEVRQLHELLERMEESSPTDTVPWRGVLVPRDSGLSGWPPPPQFLRPRGILGPPHFVVMDRAGPRAARLSHPTRSFPKLTFCLPLHRPPLCLMYRERSWSNRIL